MGRSQWVCTVEGCKANPSKRNNIERHVWLQHARKWHCQDKPEPYSVSEHKSLVEPYIRRQRGPDGSTNSPLTPPFTPPGSPTAAAKAKARLAAAQQQAAAGKRVDDVASAAASITAMTAAAKQESHIGPIRVLTPPSMHTPQPTPHGSPLTTKGGRLVTGTKSAPGSPYARRARREDLSQLNYNYSTYLAATQAQRQAQMQAASPYGTATLTNVYMGGPAATAAFNTAAAQQTLAYQQYLQSAANANANANVNANVAMNPAVPVNGNVNVGISTAHTNGTMEGAVAHQANNNNNASTNNANAHATNSNSATNAAVAAANSTAAAAAAAAAAVAQATTPHVRFLMDASAQLAGTSPTQNTANLFVPQLTPQANAQLALAQANASNNAAAAHYSLPQFNMPLMRGTNGLDYLAMACDTFSLQENNELHMKLGQDDMWRPWSPRV